MKKWIIALALSLCCTMPALAAAWDFMNTDAEGLQYYVDNQTAVKTPERAVIWTKIVRKDGSYTLDQWAILHEQKEIALMKYEVYNAAGKRILSRNVGAKKIEWKPIKPGIAEELYQSIWETAQPAATK